MFEVRNRRPQPHRDDKALVDWNGLMISSLALGSRVLEEPRYRDAAEKAAQFILKTLVRNDGRLLHRYRDGEAGIPGSLEDYAFFIHGLIDLYEATFNFALGPSRDAETIMAVVPFVENQKPLQGQTTAYVCKNHACEFSTQDIQKFEQLLEQ